MTQHRAGMSVIAVPGLGECVVRVHSRARRVSIRVLRDGSVRATRPRSVSLRSVAQLLEHHRARIQKARTEIGKSSRTSRIEPASVAYQKYKQQALKLVEGRLRHFDQHYRLTYLRVSVRNQTSRWGSCSLRRTLNFNYRIVFLPAHVVDYIVVHELCHLAEMNHSKRFWALVSETIPDHAACRKELRAWGNTLLLD